MQPDVYGYLLQAVAQRDLTEGSRRSAERLAHVEDAPAGEGAEVPERVDLLQIVVSRAVEEPALGHVEEAQHVDVEVLEVLLGGRKGAPPLRVVEAQPVALGHFAVWGV